MFYIGPQSVPFETTCIMTYYLNSSLTDLLSFVHLINISAAYLYITLQSQQRNKHVTNIDNIECNTEYHFNSCTYFGPTQTCSSCSWRSKGYIFCVMEYNQQDRTKHCYCVQQGRGIGIQIVGYKNINWYYLKRVPCGGHHMVCSLDLDLRTPEWLRRKCYTSIFFC